MTTPLRVLFVEDNQDDAELVLRELRKGGYEVSWTRVDNRPDMEHALDEQVLDLIICDHVIPGFGSSGALEVIRAREIDTPIIIVSGAAPEDVVVEAMRAGARDFISKNGLLRLVPAVARELREAAGRKERVQIVARLRDSEGRYETLFNENPAPMLLVDATTLLVVDANLSAAAFFGHSLEVLKQVTIRALSIQAQSGTWKSIQRSKEQHGYQFPDQVLRRDGTTREVDVFAVRVNQGGRSLLLATLFDQTARKEAQEGIARLAAAVEQVVDAITIMDPLGTIEYVNHAFELLTGLAQSTSIGWTLSDLLDHEAIKTAASLAAQGESWEGQVCIQLAGLHTKNVDITCSPVRDAGGSITNLVAVMRDVTSEVELDRQLRQTHKMDALGALAAGISHDFNNVLTTILTATELIKMSLPANSDLHSKVDAIYQAGLCAAGLTKQILSFSRKSEEKRMPLDLSAILKNSLQMLRSTLPLNATLESEFTSGIWVEGEPAQMHQVVMNLVINAFHAMRSKGGVLHVTLSEVPSDATLAALGLEDGRYALLTVHDTGCGMDEQTLERIFDPFFTTKPAGEGTGLGLSMVHAAVTKAGGKILVQSRLGEGSTFRIYWPCVTGREAPVTGAQPEAVNGNETVLFVDDEELLAALAKMGLQGLGYSVNVRANPLEALEEFRAHPDLYDLVFTDLAMPEMSGADLATKLREIRPEVPILLVSGLPMTKTLSVSIRGRFDGVVSKPFTPYDLASSARKVLGSTRSRLTSDPLEVPTPHPERSRKGPLVLLAEDSHMTRSMIRGWLEKANYEVREAQDGMEAWDLIMNGPDRNRFDLLLTDVVMPRMDGLELTQLVRKLDPTLPIAILTSNEDKGTIKSALNLGANEFINKPFKAPELLQCVERLLANRAARQEGRRSAETAQAVRRAQQTMVAVPEKGLPLFSLYEPLTDAGGDVFRCMKCVDGSILFILADVAGHSVLSSYAVASFLAMLSTFVGECTSLLAFFPGQSGNEAERSKCLHSCGLYGHTPCAPLQHLAAKFNQGIQGGPFAEIPVCALFGLWAPATGKLQILNAGIPHGLVSRKADGIVMPIELNGTPLGILPEPLLEETTLQLNPGDRLLFGTDGFFDVLSLDRKPFQDLAPAQWGALRESPIDWALSVICEKVRAHGGGLISDDLLVIGFEQPLLERTPEEMVLLFPSTTRAIDMACERLKESIRVSEFGAHLETSKLFDITTAVREALTNAVIHGNGNRPEANVTLRCKPNAKDGSLIVTVIDEGPGFDLEAHSPPQDPLSERGRGIPLICAYAQQVRMTGSELTMTFLLEESPHDAH